MDPASPLITPRPRLSIQASLIGALVLLAVLFCVPASFNLHNSYQRLSDSQRMATMVAIGIELFQAARNFGYERGRTNVVLNHSGPVEEMAANRDFIEQRRLEGEAALARALASLATTKVAGLDEPLAVLELARARIVALRQSTQEQMVQPPGSRDAGLSKAWFTAMSEMIDHIRGLLEAVCREMSGFDGKTVVMAQLMLKSISLRDEAAPEMSLLSGVMLSGKPIGDHMRQGIIERRGRTQQLWRDMSTWVAALGSDRLAQPVAKFQRLYFDEYLPLGVEVMQAAQAGGPYRLSQKDFLAKGVQAIEALVEIMAALTEVGSQRADAIHEQAVSTFGASLAGLVVGFIFIVTASAFVIARVINPLAAVTVAARHVAQRELEAEVPYLGREDEIGAVARAVDILKSNTRQMIAEYDELEKTNKALEKAMAEVRTLSGLLPICANCKKIRDDQGYWEQIEVYLSEHSKAQFSHGICPDCLRKLYPEVADEILST